MTFAFLLDSVPITKGVIDGETSLGGSESACLGLARALKARGHDVHIYAARFPASGEGYIDAAGVVWHQSETFHDTNVWFEWDVVVALRSFYWFGQSQVHARLRLLWNQDLLTGAEQAKPVMSVLWALDHIAYVSAYHRAQWEDLCQEIKPIGWATKNGYDPSLVPSDVTKDPHRIIHISRPERGLGPLLEMWPAVRAANPQATLQICRYQSMYDGEGSNVRATCLAFDAEVTRVQEAVGGLTYLGHLNKAQLYQAIAEAAVMWYPGIASFAETSCIAAIEAQACGTPFVGSWKGALPETVPDGVLIQGDASTEVYQAQSVSAVLELLEQCRHQAFNYRKRQQAGRAHVKAYTFAVIAAEWEAQIETWFRARYESHKVRVLEQLLHEDDHTAAKVVADDLAEDYHRALTMGDAGWDADTLECVVNGRDAVKFCDDVVHGRLITAADYAAHALQDPLEEAQLSTRYQVVGPQFDGRHRLVDIACGNGSAAIAFLLQHPQLFVIGIDYAEGNIQAARAAAERAGVADRCYFEQVTIWDFEAQTFHPEWHDWVATRRGSADAMFVGEFVEHVADTATLIDGLEAVCAPGARVVYTCPSGPFVELLARGDYPQRSHVHHFKRDDIREVWGQKVQSSADYLSVGFSRRGMPIGHWLIRYDVDPTRAAGTRDYAARTVRTRPLQRLTVGIIAHNAANDLGRCLETVWGIADEIIVGDTGSTDRTAAIAQEYGARVLTLAPVTEQPEGFAGARNAVLDAATGDWFLWIDCDELLMEPNVLRRYLDGAVFNGFVLHQTHLYVDTAPMWDIPIRVFRTGRDIRFYGCVHEQPQQGGPSGDIFPTLEPFDTYVAHTGYLTDAIREHKRITRNYPLILKDQHVFPDRFLGKVILLRETVLQAEHLRAVDGGLSDRARAGYQHALTLWDEYFADPADKPPLNTLARPWFETAIRALGTAIEFDLAMGGRPGGILNGQSAAHTRIWVRSVAEFERILAFRTAEFKKRLEPPPLKTDPFHLTSEQLFVAGEQPAAAEVSA